jgi:hypothetical protein
MGLGGGVPRCGLHAVVTGQAQADAEVGGPDAMSSSRSEPAERASGLDQGKLAELWASQFQHLSGIASAAVGGLLILWQIGALRDPFDLGVALAAAVGAVVAALVGHAEVLDGAQRGELRVATLKRHRLAVFFALGIALGATLHALLAA